MTITCCVERTRCGRADSGFSAQNDTVGAQTFYRALPQPGRLIVRADLTSSSRSIGQLYARTRPFSPEFLHVLGESRQVPVFEPPRCSARFGAADLQDQRRIVYARRARLRIGITRNRATNWSDAGAVARDENVVPGSADPNPPHKRDGVCDMQGLPCIARTRFRALCLPVLLARPFLPSVANYHLSGMTQCPRHMTLLGTAHFCYARAFRLTYSRMSVVLVAVPLVIKS